jgi:hypothetical protein
LARAAAEGAANPAGGDFCFSFLFDIAGGAGGKLPGRLAPAAARDLSERGMTLTTLADVRELIEKHLPAHYRDKRSWLHVAAELDNAAAGGNAADVAVALRIALHLEGVECRPR